MRTWTTNSGDHTCDLDTLTNLQALRDATNIDCQQPKVKCLNKGKPQSFDAAADMQDAR